MDINKGNILLVVLCFMVIAMFSTCTCNKEIFGCANTTFTFNSMSSIYPDKDSINIGDTLWIEANAPTTLKDSATGQLVDYSRAENMGIAVILVSLHPQTGEDAGTSYATNEFDYILKIGLISTIDQYAMNYLYQEINNNYSFKLAIIPKQKGVFRIDLSDAVNVYTKDNKYTKATFDLSIIDTKQHFYLYNVVSPTAQPDNYALAHYYCFKVY